MPPDDLSQRYDWYDAHQRWLRGRARREAWWTPQARQERAGRRAMWLAWALIAFGALYFGAHLVGRVW